VRVLLVVEDDRDSNEATAEVLREEGYSCLSAFDGERGLELLLERAPDLVLLDLRLPGLSGEELLVRKAGVPAVAAIPVVVITAVTPAPALDNVVAMLLKPFTTEDLIEVVRKHAPQAP
jgi:CheY-like chemotaxis protein